MTKSTVPRASPWRGLGQSPNAVDLIIEAGARMAGHGWTPSTGGNISLRAGDGRIAITRSGVRKGEMTRADVIEVDLDGRPLMQGDRPSAETGLHCQIYRRFPDIGAVLHGHSVAATVLSRHPGGSIDFTGYEMIKAFDGRETHDATCRLPILDNDQDIERLAGRLADRLEPDWTGYGLRGHGIYVWGRDMADAMSKLEAMEFLLECELRARSLT